MSFNINWNSLEQESLLDWSKKLLNDALNSGKRPSVLASDIEIQDLHFGENAPVIEILEIGDLDSDKFRGIFKIKYTGDSSINLSTKIQANPMNIFYNNSLSKYSDFILPNMSMINQNFTIPINLKLSKIHLSGIIIIVFIKSKGLTLVFKNDPLESIDVSSTFDAIPTIRNFLQIQIENQIRDLFREILPNVLYKISQRWTKNIHSQLLNGNVNKLEKDKQVVMYSDIDSDGPDVSSKTIEKLSNMGITRQSLSLNIRTISEFVQRSTVEKYLIDHSNMLGINQQSSFFYFNDHKYSNGLPIDLFTNNDTNYDMIDKAIVDVSKYQLINYNNKNQTNNKQVRKPRRRVIKLTKSTKAYTEIKTPPAITETEQTVVSDDGHSETTLVEDSDAENDSTLVIDQKLRSKRALSSSSASVEYLRSVYNSEKQKKELHDTIAKAIRNTKPLNKPYIITQFANEQKKSESLKSPLNDRNMLNLSLGLNHRGNLYKYPHEKEEMLAKSESTTNDKNGGTEAVGFFSSNSVLSDIPPPYVP